MAAWPLAPETKLRFVVWASVSVPWATLSVSLSALLVAAASGSVVEISLPLALEKTSGVVRGRAAVVDEALRARHRVGGRLVDVEDGDAGRALVGDDGGLLVG